MKSFEIEMQVRDYECDIQGIVNNAVYQNYLEHTGMNFCIRWVAILINCGWMDGSQW